MEGRGCGVAGQGTAIPQGSAMESQLLCFGHASCCYAEYDPSTFTSDTYVKPRWNDWVRVLALAKFLLLGYLGHEPREG